MIKRMIVNKLIKLWKYSIALEAPDYSLKVCLSLQQKNDEQTIPR